MRIQLYIINSLKFNDCAETSDDDHGSQESGASETNLLPAELLVQQKTRTIVYHSLFTYVVCAVRSHCKEHRKEE